MTNRLSLRTELLVSLAIISAAALTARCCQRSGAVRRPRPRSTRRSISASSSPPTSAFSSRFVAYQVDRVVRPAAASRRWPPPRRSPTGDLARRLDPADTQEMHNLSTSVNRMTDRLLEERAQLVRAEKLASVGRLAAGIAHEIGNPLGRDQRVRASAAERAGGNRAHEEALAGLGARVRAHRSHRPRTARLSRGRSTARPRTSISTTCSIRSASCSPPRASAQADRSPAEPRGASARVAGDRHDLEQVLVNLLLNAIEAMDGVGTLEVILRQTTRAELLAGARRAHRRRGSHRSTRRPPREHAMARTGEWQR